MLKGMGWKPSLPKFFKNYVPEVKPVADTIVDLSEKMPPIYDQGETSSCTGNGVAACVEYLRICQGLKDFRPSRLFIYWNGRTYENATNHDDGAQISDIIQGVKEYGYCSETDWPFIVERVNTPPTQSVYLDAKHHSVFNVNDVKQDLEHMKYILKHHGPIVFGSVLYSSFDSPQVAETGVVPMPKQNEKMEGGHCMVLVGFNDLKKQFKIRNSWGPEWGNGGYGYMPYDYILNPDLTDDLHVLWVTKDSK